MRRYELENKEYSDNICDIGCCIIHSQCSAVENIIKSCRTNDDGFFPLSRSWAGLFIYGLIENRINKRERKDFLTKKELPYTVAMVVLDIVAPILLMLGITMSNSANVSLLNNFEIVATSMIALVVFKEAISKRLWFAIALAFFNLLPLPALDGGYIVMSVVEMVMRKPVKMRYVYVLNFAALMLLMSLGLLVAVMDIFYIMGH